MNALVQTDVISNALTLLVLLVGSTSNAGLQGRLFGHGSKVQLEDVLQVSLSLSVVFLQSAKDSFGERTGPIGQYYPTPIAGEQQR